MKGWYKRNFDDWPDEGDDTKSAASGRSQSCLQYSRESNNLSQTRIPYSQAYPQNEQHYKTPQRLGGSQRQWPSSFSQQGYGLAQPQAQNATRFGLGERGCHKYQATSQSSPQKDTLQNQNNNNAVHPSSGQFLPRHHHPNQQSLSYGDTSPSAVREPSLLYEQDCLRFGQKTQPQQATQVGRVNYPARHNPLPQAGLPLEHYVYYGAEGGIIGDNNRSPAGSHEWTSLGYFESLLNMDCNTGVDTVDESVDLESGGHIAAEATNVGANGPVLASQSHLTRAYQAFNDHRTSDLASKSPVLSPPRHEVSTSSGQQHVEVMPMQQIEPTFPVASNPHSGMALRPTMAPRHMVPPIPPQNSPVFRRRGGQPSRHPIQMQDSSIVAISPYGCSIHPRRKRARRQIESETQRAYSPRFSETQDPISIFHDQHEALNNLSVPVSSSSSSFNTPQVTTRKPLSNQPVNPTNTSARSSVRGSGYVSFFELAMEEKLRNSLSSLKLTDEPKFKYSESDDGFVDVKVKTNWRVRRSYIESMDLHNAQVGA